MNTVNQTSTHISRVLGVAFLLQFVTSFGNGVFLKSALITPDSVSESMIKIANNPLLMRAYILIDVLTALGIIFLGGMLFLTLRKQSEKVALVAFGFYIAEAVVLAVSRVEAFSLLGISQAYVAAGYPAYMLSMGSVALQAMEFAGGTLLMLVFCPGAILFYALLYRSAIVPRALSMWGVITVAPMLMATVFGMMGYPLSFFIYIPYVPFELVIGIWILVRGINESSAASKTMQPSLIARASA